MKNIYYTKLNFNMQESEADILWSVCKEVFNTDHSKQKWDLIQIKVNKQARVKNTVDNMDKV